MKAPSARDLEARFLPSRPRELPHEALVAVREHSKRMFGNQDRLEVAVAITRVALDKVNATDLHRDIDVAVNRIRTQLLILEAMGLLGKPGREDGKRVFKRLNRDDHFWAFAIAEYDMVVRDYLGPSSPGDLAKTPPAPRRPSDPVAPKQRR